jgi:hypothetical protein
MADRHQSRAGKACVDVQITATCDELCHQSCKWNRPRTQPDAPELRALANVSLFALLCIFVLTAVITSGG